MSYSKYLRESRESAGLSQQKLADLITARGHKVSAGNISNIERAYYRRRDGSESQPDRQFVILAAELLDQDVNEALQIAGLAPEDFAFGQPRNPKELLDVLSHIPGFDGTMFSDRFTDENLENLSPEAFEEIVRAIEHAFAWALEKQRRGGGGQSSGTPISNEEKSVPPHRR